MGCSRQVLVQVMLFQFLGPDLAQDDATPNFFPDHLFLDSLGKVLKTVKAQNPLQWEWGFASFANGIWRNGIC